MSVDVTPALRMVGRGVVAAGALAAGAALGAIAERSLLRATAGPGEDELPVGFGTLRGDIYEVMAADGTVLHVEVDELASGEAPLTIIFAHGYALNLDSWHFQRQALRGKARLVFYDQRSHGRSGRADFDTHHVDQLGHDLGAVIDAVAPSGPLMLVGHSMGGMTVMALAAQRPELFAERIYGVALIATTAGGLASGPLGLPPGVGRVFHQVAPAVAAAIASRKGLVERTRWNQSDLGLLLTRMYSFGSTATDQAARFVASMVSSTPVDVVAEFLPALQEHDKVDVLGTFEQVELLVIVGDTDRLTPKEQSEEIVRRLPGAEFVVIPDSGHMVTLEKHEEVNEHLLALLRRVERDIADDQAGGVA
ncbi:MAG: alpha/beta fold hydrolase [Actinomycetales bacterium]|nr:alpha/beta fold hydrolase [Actinomycetales bacterium]